MANRTAAASSIRIGMQALRASPLRSVLSTLGVIMGVASLVAVLALGDGVERFTRGQIEQTTDVQTITVTSRTHRTIDGVRVPQADYPVLTLAEGDELQRRLGARARVSIVMTGAGMVSSTDSAARHAAAVTATVPRAEERMRLAFAAGRFFTEDEVQRAAPVAVLSHEIAAALVGADGVGALLGRSVRIQDRPFRVVGLLAPLPAEMAQRPRSVIVPFTVAADAFTASPEARVPLIMVRAARVEDVEDVRHGVEEWLAASHGDWTERFTVTAEAASRIRQVEQGMLVFKLMMGSFAGISLIVGGIGIMNVLLAAVTERTREIGIRRAIGARRRDILLQFLSESVTISTVGSALGVVLGLLGAFGATAVMRRMSEAPVYAAFEWYTLVVAAAVAAAVGLAFGTYPAFRAARLSPIDAIRHE